MHLLAISEDIFLFIAGLGLLQGILLAVLIYFHPRSDHSVNKFLAFYIASLSLIMSGPLWLKIMDWDDTFFMSPAPALVGPFLLFYIKSFKETITWKKAWPHFILFIVYLVATYLWVLVLKQKYPDAKDMPAEAFRSSVGYIFFIVKYAQLIIYYFLSRRELILYQRSIRQLFSETSSINLNWAKWLVNGYILIVLASIVIFGLMAKFPDSFYLLYVINIAIATPYVYLSSYRGITQPSIWQKKAENKQQLENKIHEAEEMVSNKPQRQNVNDDRVDEIVAKVNTLMEHEKIYQEPELTLQNLADKVQFPAHQVSLAINEGMKKSFYDLINGYRVEEAKRLLLDSKNQNYTILSVGFEAGFNSKTTFNTVFKKFTGMTPTAYRDKHKQAATAA